MTISSVIHHLPDGNDLYVIGSSKAIRPHGGLNIMSIKVDKFLDSYYVFIYYYGQRDKTHINVIQKIPLTDKIELFYAREYNDQDK